MLSGERYSEILYLAYQVHSTRTQGCWRHLTLALVPVRTYVGVACRRVHVVTDKIELGLRILLHVYYILAGMLASSGSNPSMSYLMMER